jgi:tRNA1Val (adenine37-N6)-methyltransferase
MPNPWFRFKQFTVKQDRCAMKVSTDGNLLGAWTRYDGASRILDIGTGTGLLALIAAQRNQQAHIDAVELDPDAAAQARENVAESPWPQRIMVHHADVRTWKTNALYDLVLCNPPFYKGHIPSSEDRTAMAKHDGMLSLAALLSTMARLTVAEARISMIVPTDRLAELEKVSATEGFSLSRICEVSYRLGKPPKRVLIELSRGNHAPVLEELTVETGTGKPTPEFRALLSDLELDF